MVINNTAPTLVLICLISSMEKVIVATVIGRNSTPAFPDRIGVRSSLTRVLLAMLQQKSNTVSGTIEKIFDTLLKMLLLLLFKEKPMEGNVKGREGLSALCRHERRAPIRENPSPREWWSLNMRTPAAWLVGYLIM